MHITRTRSPLVHSFWSAYSLRTRYLAVTVLVALIIITGVLLAQSYVKRASDMRSHNLELRNEASLLVRQLRGSTLDVEKNLHAYLRHPSKEGALLVENGLTQTISLQKELYALEWFESSEMGPQLDDFRSDLQGLQMTIDHLMQSRIKRDNNDAFVTVRNSIFQPATQGFKEAVSTALQQLELPENAGLHATLYHPLQELQAEWMRIDTLAESLGSSHTGGKLSPHNANFEQLLKHYKALLASLGEIDKQLATASPNSPLQAELRRIRDCAAQWNEGLEQLEILAPRGDTHVDVKFVATNIDQQFLHIREYLQLLDSTLEKFYSSDSTSLIDIADTTIRTLWLLALLGVALLITGAIYFERSILAPITQVARALRAEAHGETHAPLMAAQSRETHHLLEAFNEMHQQVLQRQQSLEYLALHDSLTGLANREQLARAIQQILSSPAAEERVLALLMIGLNRFKEINNSLGHNVGDQLLIAVAQRLTVNNPADVLIARLNGVGFALLLTGSKSDDADTRAREIIRALDSPFEVENQSLYISATIGIALAPEHGNQPLELLQKAEVAMQVAKQQKINLTHYSSEHDQHALRRLALANALRQEIRGPQDTLSLVYQPQIEMRTGRVCGIEALLRWNPPIEGLVSPDELFPIAEQTGLIYQLTPWVIERAFQEFSSLKELDGVKPVLAVNLSALNLHDVEFPKKLQQMMEKWAIDPASLQLEITESVMMADPERAHRTLGQIHSMGIDLTIDDFGTGFSSLTYLKHLPVNKLKIDKSFVISMLQDENDAVIIRSTIDMAHNMGLKVVAEGIENQETYDLLEILDCDIAQGYLISAPLNITALERWFPLQQKLRKLHKPLYADHYPG